MWDVAMLGWDLLHVSVRNQTKYELLWWFIVQNMRGVEHLTIPQKIKIDKPRIEMAWWLSALFHDHAYPLAHFMQGAVRVIEFLSENPEALKESLRDVNRLLQGFDDLFYFGAKHLFQSLLKKSSCQLCKFECLIREFLVKGLYEQWGVIQEEIIKKNENEKECLYDHGLWSAANLAGLLGSEFPGISKPKFMQESNFEYYLKDVFKAIILHSNDTAIHINCDPLAWILTLCDEVQEWNRFTAYSTGATPEMEYIEIRGIVEDQNGRFFGEELKFVFFCPSPKIIDETGWDIKIFIESKLKNLRRFRVPEDFHPRYIKIKVQDPLSDNVCCEHQIDMFNGNIEDIIC